MAAGFLFGRASMDEFLRAWDALPLGSFEAEYEGRRYGVTRTVRHEGRQGWIWAEERGGVDRISANLYRLKSGPRLKPCEMSSQKVIHFIMTINPIERL
jgi:hypothetical protein